jgi:hypothetical protein
MEDSVCGDAKKGFACCFHRALTTRPATALRPPCSGRNGLCADPTKYDCHHGEFVYNACGYVSPTAKCCTKREGSEETPYLIAKVDHSLLKQCWPMESAGMDAGFCIGPQLLCYQGTQTPGVDEAHGRRPLDKAKARELCHSEALTCCWRGVITTTTPQMYMIGGEELASNDVAGTEGGSEVAVAPPAEGGEAPAEPAEVAQAEEPSADPVA